MLVCPQCGFNNPDTNNFCQECGTTLTQNTCAACGSPVAFDALTCSQCGAPTGVLWWALLVGSASNEPFLDPLQRYKRLEPGISNRIETQTRVLDCQPLMLSPLEAFVEQHLDAIGSEELQADLLDQLNTASHQIPAIAHPYLALRSQFYQVIPGLHDAWKTEEQQVLLLEDRTDLTRLIDLWMNQKPAPSLLQILSWLYEMADLWEACAPWHVQQSLITLENLRVDDDQALSLVRLYNNPTPTDLPLSAFGQFWHHLLGQLPDSDVSADLVALVSKLKQGDLKTVDDLRSHLKAIARAIEIPQPPEPARPETLEIPADQLALMTEEEADSDTDDLPTVVLPMQLFSLEEVGHTDVGQQRDHNEDYFGINASVIKVDGPKGPSLNARSLYVLCDGMGGHAGGEVASAMAVNTLQHYFREVWKTTPLQEGISSELSDADTLIAAVQSANQAIYAINQENDSLGSGRMGTTLVMLIIQDTRAAVVHVGDSRLYRYTRKRGLEQITIDHEVGQREIQRGVDPEIAYARPDAYQLTQALGPRDQGFVKPDVQFLDINEDSLFLLCSDGLSDNDLLETHWKTYVEPLLSSQTNLDRGLAKLMDLANEQNGHDNITAIAIRAKVRPNLAHIER